MKLPYFMTQASSYSIGLFCIIFCINIIVIYIKLRKIIIGTYSVLINGYTTNDVGEKKFKNECLSLKNRPSNWEETSRTAEEIEKIK